MNLFMRIGTPLALIILVAGPTGCAWPLGEVPRALRIDTGNEPDKHDQYTRFRTTYYFRVVDSCRINDGFDQRDYAIDQNMFREKKKGKIKIVNDALYRFRMTGKASALFNKVSFGSGVLRADQIDPFGSRVEYENGQFKVKAGYIVRQKELRDALFEEIKQLLVLHKELKQNNNLGATELEEIIKNKVRLLDEGDTTHKTDTGTATNSITNHNHQCSSSPNREAPNPFCPDGSPIKKSYFLYGPEGVRELDPDERLLMTMSSDSKPLIGMLEELSGRQRRTLSNVNSGANIVVREEAWIAESQEKLKEFEEKLERGELPDESAADIVTQLTGSRKLTRTLPQVTK